MTETSPTHAKPGYAFMRVVTPGVAREYELPISGAMTAAERRSYTMLRDLAELHRTSIESNPYRTL